MIKNIINKYKYLSTDNHSYKILSKEANILYNKILNLTNQLEIIKKENTKLKNIINNKRNITNYKNK